MNILILLNTEDCLEVFLILLIKVWYRDMYRIVNGVSRYVSYREVVYRCIPSHMHISTRYDINAYKIVMLLKSFTGHLQKSFLYELKN